MSEVAVYGGDGRLAEPLFRKLIFENAPAMERLAHWTRELRGLQRNDKAAHSACRS